MHWEESHRLDLGLWFTQKYRLTCRHKCQENKRWSCWTIKCRIITERLDILVDYMQGIITLASISMIVLLVEVMLKLFLNVLPMRTSWWCRDFFSFFLKHCMWDRKFEHLTNLVLCIRAWSTQVFRSRRLPNSNINFCAVRSYLSLCCACIFLFHDLVVKWEFLGKSSFIVFFLVIWIVNVNSNTSLHTLFVWIGIGIYGRSKFYKIVFVSSLIDIGPHLHTKI